MNEMNKPLGIVTPEFQSQKRFGSGLTLLEIVENLEMFEKFRSHTFPHVSKTSDGLLFINPLRHVKSSMEDYNTKWLVLDENYKPVHNHDYPMVALPKKGYIMKIVYHHYNKNIAGGFDVEYLIDYNNIQINFETTIVGYNVTEKFELPKFIPLEYMDKIDKFSDKVEFEKVYLKDIFDV